VGCGSYLTTSYNLPTFRKHPPLRNIKGMTVLARNR
jgi:hypothetical protein